MRFERIGATRRGRSSVTRGGRTWPCLYAIQYPERTARLVYLSGTGIDPAWHQDYRRNREAKLPPAERERLRLPQATATDGHGGGA